MNEAVLRQLSRLPEYLSQHLQLTVTALGVGIPIALALGVVATRVRWLKPPILTIAGVIQTIPSIAMLALMVPLLNMIGFLPAVIALTLYSILPVIQNTVTGIEGVDADLVEAGRGLGMTQNQLLWKVQLPLAAPVIIAGVRTATVWVVGIATLSTPVGATSLGNYIFSGLSTRNDVAILVGVVAAALLAIALNVLIRVLERAAEHRNMRRAAMGVGGISLVIVAGFVPNVVQRFRSGAGSPSGSVMVGAKDFTEQYILADLLKRRLDDAGFDAAVTDNLGSTIIFDALAANQIGVYVDYSGTVWSNYMNQTEQRSADEVYRRVSAWLRDEHGIVSVGRLGFENTYALAMPRARAEALGIETVSDLRRHASGMTIAGSIEFFERPEWNALRQAYNLNFQSTRSMDPALMYEAVGSGSVDVIAAFSTDGRIPAFDLTILRDPQNVFPPYDAMIMLSPAMSEIASASEALEPLVRSITNRMMQEANRKVSLEGQGSSDAAAWLDAQITADAREATDDSASGDNEEK